MSIKKCSLCNSSFGTDKIKLNVPICENCINKIINEHLAKIKFDNIKLAISSPSTLMKEELEEYVIGFGKNKGKKILEVEPNYIKWCLENFEGLRDIDMFQEALHRLTGEKVDQPAANALNSRNNRNKTLPKIYMENEEVHDFPF